MSEFRYTTEIAVRLRDLDPMGHVNNGVYATYLEQARERYFADVVGKGLLDRTNSVTASLAVEYERPIEADEEAVEVAVTVPEVGESSVRIEYEVRGERGVVATGETVQVAFDVEEERSCPVPEAWRERIRTFESRGE